LLSGETCKQIATRLGLQPRTVFWHMNQLKKHFGTQTLAESVGRLTAIHSVKQR